MPDPPVGLTETPRSSNEPVWTQAECDDFSTCVAINNQIGHLIAQQRAVWGRFCKSRDSRREAMSQGVVER